MQQTLSSYPYRSNAPAVAHVSMLRPFVWLKMGWHDLMRCPGPAIGHGALLVALGWVVLFFCSLHIDLFATAITGFLLLAPLFGAGMYEMARLTEEGQPARFDASLEGALRNGRHLAALGGVLALLAVAWALCSRVLFATAFGGTPPSMFGEINRTLLEWHYPGFFTSYVGTGAIFAAIAFVASVVAAPMIFDGAAATKTAIATSIRTVAANPLAMVVWAALIVALTAVGFALLLLGLAIVFPLLGFATWHAYRELVPRA